MSFLGLVMANAEPRQFHVLLIGIDRYDKFPLAGCVNDIDAFADFLRSRMGVPAAAIRKLVAPALSAQRIVGPHEGTPTYAEIVAALKSLTAEPVRAGDCVLVYYSGHGSFQRIPETESYLEGLVPLDYAQSGLLFDVELNRLLQAIAERSHDLTVILDCCHAAGTARRPPKELGKLAQTRTRFLPSERDASLYTQSGTARLAQLRSLNAPRPIPEEYTIVAACHADERAGERSLPLESGRPRGLLSYCLLELLEQYPTEALDRLRWSDIWEPLKESLLMLTTAQQPQILGPRERRIFGGPWRPQDWGYSIKQKPGGGYTVFAGSLAGLGPGAELAVYGPEPARFPPLGSKEDLDIRRGSLVIERVAFAQSVARAEPAGAQVDVSGTVRARLVRPGPPDRLRVAVLRSVEATVRRILSDGQARDHFILLTEDDASAEACVGQFPNGDLWIGDELHVPDDLASPGPMARVRRADAAQLVAGLRAGLNHYAQYVIPLRLYRNRSLTLPEQALTVRLFDCNRVPTPAQMEFNQRLWHEVRKDSGGRYWLRSGDQIAIHVANSHWHDLFVFVLLCSLEGKVQLVGSDVLVAAQSGKLFWLAGAVGTPFEMACPEDQRWGLDRLVVIGSEQKGIDLSVLQQKLTLEQAILAALGTRSVERQVRNTPGPSWTATQLVIRVDGER